jgi:hypothetical protein
MIFQASHIYRRILQDEVQKLATRNQVFHFYRKENGPEMAGVIRLTFKPLDGEIGH